jgi:transposase
VGNEPRQGVCPKRTRIVALYTDPPQDTTILCVDELGPVSARTYPSSPGWSPSGHRIKVPLEYSRGYEKAWVYGALRLKDGKALTLTASSRNTAGYLQLLMAIEANNPDGDVYVIADNLSSHTSQPILMWLAEHPRVHQVFIPVGACWLNLIEGWWRLLRRHAYAGQSFATTDDIALVTATATTQLNRRARPWIWGRSPPPPRHLRRRFLYSL